MRTLLRAGAIALAASSIVLTGAAAQAAPKAGEVSFSVGRLVLSPGEQGYTGSLAVIITNGTDVPYDEGITVVEPLARTLKDVGNGICGINTLPDERYEYGCGLSRAIPPGGSRRITITFESPAAPQSFARRSVTSGSVAVAGKTTEFPALFQSSTGSVRNPVSYTPAEAQSLNVTAPDAVTLTRQEDGTYSATVPVTVHNNNDAAQNGVGTALAVPAGLDPFPYSTNGTCGVGATWPAAPAGGSAVGCFHDGGLLGEGESRTFDWILTAPSDAQPGVQGTATVGTNLSGHPGAGQTDGANLTSFEVSIAG